jgi:predicted 3-demethylubiquinone-9 3-methyltransferase (glyoxalase superfamily)
LEIFSFTCKPGPDKEGTIAHSTFFWKAKNYGSDSAQRHDFTFNEGVSIINCKDQEEINLEQTFRRS